MKKFYVIGNNTSKSLSPLIFNYWFKKYKIKAKYGYIELNNKNFDKKIKEVLKQKNLLGLNVTIPFKQKIIKHIDTIDKHSRNIGAINCVTIKSKTRGYNTDWAGYLGALPSGYKIKDKNVLIIGYGGAAQAIHYLLNNKKAKNIIVLNRSKKKLIFGKNLKYTKSFNTAIKLTKPLDLIINTTPSNPAKIIGKNLINSETLLSDIVYKPKTTKFLSEFPNNKKIYGIYMLLYQAIPCFKKWFGFNPKLDQELLSILEKKIK